VNVPTIPKLREHCPRCGSRLVYRRDGIFRWRECPRSKRCGWTVFTHGDDPRDKRGEPLS